MFFFFFFFSKERKSEGGGQVHNLSNCCRRSKTSCACDREEEAQFPIVSAKVDSTEFIVVGNDEIFGRKVNRTCRDHSTDPREFHDRIKRVTIIINARSLASFEKSISMRFRRSSNSEKGGITVHVWRYEGNERPEVCVRRSWRFRILETIVRDDARVTCLLMMILLLWHTDAKRVQERTQRFKRQKSNFTSCHRSLS